MVLNNGKFLGQVYLQPKSFLAPCKYILGLGKNMIIGQAAQERTVLLKDNGSPWPSDT